MAESSSVDVPDSDTNSEYLGAMDTIPVEEKVFINPPGIEGGVTTKELKERVEIDSIKANTSSRKLMVWVIACIFIGLNGAVMFFIHEAFLNDVAQMSATSPLKPEDRLITTEVVMSLIGATVVQVGIAVIAIVSYLFPKQN
jgi:hypothetical protein